MKRVITTEEYMELWSLRIGYQALALHQEEMYRRALGILGIKDTDRVDRWDGVYEALSDPDTTVAKVLKRIGVKRNGRPRKQRRERRP